jgi:hypothetical protein
MCHTWQYGLHEQTARDQEDHTECFCYHTIPFLSGTMISHCKNYSCCTYNASFVLKSSWAFSYVTMELISNVLRPFPSQTPDALDETVSKCWTVSLY